MPREDCDHLPHPRKATRCLKCDAVIPLTIRDRNPELERELVEFAARGVCDPEALIVHMQTRATSLSSEYVRDPMTVKLGDHLKAGREELPDCGNRLVWWLEENPEHPEADRKMRALSLVAEAYELMGEED